MSGDGSEQTKHVGRVTLADDRLSDSSTSDGGDDESSSEDNNERRRYRKQSFRSMASAGLVSVNPSPRVSTYDRPNRILLIHRDTDSTDVTQRKKRRLLKVIVLSSFLICLVSLIGAIIFMASHSPAPPYCRLVDSDYVIPRDFQNPDVLDDLTPQEYDAVKSFVLQNDSLAVTSFDSASVNSSYIFMIDLFLPNKNETIHYLDSGETRPSRDAIVTIVRGNLVPPVVEEYIVSPASSPQKIVPFKNPSYRHETIPYESRPLDFVDFKHLIPFVINKLTEQLYPLLVESFGLHYHNCTTGVDCLRIFDRAPYERKNGSRKTWFWLFPDVEGYYLQPLGLNFLVDHSSTNTSDWKVKQIIYNGVRFNSVIDLMKAYDDKSLALIHCHHCRKHSSYSSYRTRESLSDRPLQGPRMYEPEGKRFKVKGQRILYNNWKFRYGMRPTTGLQLLDVRFNGSRIAYEISLQEVLVMYAENGKHQTMSNIYHTPRLLGASSMELVKGVDCPDTAVYLHSFMLANSENVKTLKYNICVFEQTGARPVSRHFAKEFDNDYEFYGGTTDYHLIVRSIANVWNSDFIFDFIFHSNGAIETKVAKTGYVRSSYLPENNLLHGRPIVDHIYADIDIDLFNYKVDLDVSGVRNKYSVVNIEIDTVSDTSSDPRMSVSTKTVSAESKDIPYDGNTFQHHLITDQFLDGTKSYRIVNKSPLPSLISKHITSKFASWAKYPIIVTKRKESERSSSSIFAHYDPLDSLLDFDSFVDGEDIDGEDLVTWVTIGSHHIPGTEDIPVTQTTWNTHSFLITPHNYFSKSANVNSDDSIVLRPSSEPDHIHSKVIYGTRREAKCIPNIQDVKQFDGVRHDYV